MGLFSFVGKAIKGVAKVVGGVAKVAGGLGLIPGGGLIGKAAGILLQQKQPMSSTATKIQLRDPRVMRGNIAQGGYAGQIRQTYGVRPPPAILRASPVMPGGAVATTRGIVARSASPPASFAGVSSGSSSKPRKRRKATSTGKKRRTRSGRKLKFGSPAWRKKYLGHGKRKRRRRAA